MTPPFTQGRRLFGSRLIIWCHLYDCRGRRPRRPVYKNIIAICPGSRGRLPLQVCTVFVVFGVGAIRNVLEENLRLAKWSSVIYKNIILFKKDRRGRRSLQDLWDF